MLFTLCYDDRTDDHVGPEHPDEVREPMDPDEDYETLDELIASVERDDEDAIGLERSAEWCDDEDAESERERFESRRAR